MKALQIKLTLLLLFTGMVNAQIVNIPDANFKNRLVNTFCTDTNGDYVDDSDVDTNDDGEIQIIEAMSITNLSFRNSYETPISIQIVNISGIENFQNLVTLEFGFNQVQNINLNNLINLKYLQLNNNLFQNLNLNNLVSLEYLDCSSNQLSNLDLSLNLNLLTLDCRSNQISSLNINHLVNLSSLAFSENLISSINLSNLIEITSIQCSNNQLTELNLNGLINLHYLDFGNNQISSMDFSGLNNLEQVECYYTLITYLDFSNCSSFSSLGCHNNPNLERINIKNGVQHYPAYVTFENNPNLSFICCDLDDFFAVNYLMGANNLTNITFNDYCSFTPGGQFNTITGTTTFDGNSNGCDITDPVISNVKINITDGTNSGSTFTNNLGNYNFYTIEPNLYIAPVPENPTYYNTSGSAFNFLNGDFGQTGTVDFCISANGVHPDLEVVLAPITPARPGFDAVYQLIYKNKGNQTLSGSVNLVFDDTKTDFVSANPIVDNLAVNSLTWNFTNLLPFESRSISLTLNVNSPLETPAVNIGDVLNFTATINPISGDELPDDNSFVYNQTVVGSYDPNDITCLEGNNVAPSEIGEYLHYIINFENTGNYPAENVVVKTIVDTTKFDIDSLQLLNTSNPVDARITGNVVEFIFENIQLGGPGGHGHILLKIKSKNTLVTGDAVAKNANIYFDYNAPVDTGMATTVFQSLSNAIFEKDNSINVSPNPASGIVNINSNFNIKKVELYDVQGRVLETQIGETKTLDISEKTNGIYFLKITTVKGSKVEKVVKK